MGDWQSVIMNEKVLESWGPEGLRGKIEAKGARARSRPTRTLTSRIFAKLAAKRVPNGKKFDRKKNNNALSYLSRFCGRDVSVRSFSLVLRASRPKINDWGVLS